MFWLYIWKLNMQWQLQPVLQGSFTNLMCLKLAVGTFTVMYSSSMLA